MEEYFHREWVRALFSRAVEELRRRCDAAGRGRRFTLFERYDLQDVEGGLERPSYADLAAELAIPVTQVTNDLAAARRELRSIVLDLLRELTGSEDELRSEARDVLGVDLP
jgi:hypothetical protein